MLFYNRSEDVDDGVIKSLSKKPQSSSWKENRGFSERSKTMDESVIIRIVNWFISSYKCNEIRVSSLVS